MVLKMSVKEKYDINQPIYFKKGMFDLNDEFHINYQLNRTINWNRGDLEEIKSVAKDINNFDDWKRVLIQLGDKALEEDRIENAIAYYRMSEFYMNWEDPDKLKYYKYARELFYDYYSDYFDDSNGDAIVELLEAPYEDTTMPVMHVKPEGEPKDCIVIHGGFDSYYEEFMFPILYLREKGFEVYLFEGPGQGEMLRLKNKYMTHEWEKVTGAILDAFDLNDVTLVGISLGGFYAPRAAAFDKRISRVVAWTAYPKQWTMIEINMGKSAVKGLKFLSSSKTGELALKHLKKQAKKGDLSALALMDVFYKANTKTFSDTVKFYDNFDLTPVAHKIDQDFLIMHGNKDTICNYRMALPTIGMLTNVKSLTFRLLTDKEEAGDHCHCGNMKLALDVLIDWLNGLKRRDSWE